MEKYYITTPIYYINDKPHIGHAYTTIVADTLARYNRLKGRDVCFLTGTDENSGKNIEAAERHYGKKDLSKEEIQKYLDEMAAIWQRTWDDLEISNNDFIRTTEPRHIKAVRKFFKLVWDNGDIYKGMYEGYYCDGCEAFVNESEIIDGKCSIHKREPKKIKEENWFFALTKYREKLLMYIEDNPEFIQPKSRRNEVISYIKDFAEDVSITRESVKWGIDVPEIEGQVLYVWFDALLNYLSGIGFGTDEDNFNHYWPANVHLVGKDIIKFHCALWPAMLFSAGLPLPKTIFAHGFFTIDGEKMSKSLGNVADPVEVAQKYSNDVLRYYLLREISFGEDGDFSFKRLEERYESDLANGLGNLVSRVLSMVEKYLDGKVPKEIKKDVSDFWQKYIEATESFKFHNALSLVWEEIAYCDKLVDENKPWEIAKSSKKEELSSLLYELLERIRHIAWALYPYLPDVSERILSSYGIIKEEQKIDFKELQKWGGLKEGQKIEKGEALFPRLDS